MEILASLSVRRYSATSRRVSRFLGGWTVLALALLLASMPSSSLADGQGLIGDFLEPGAIRLQSCASSAQGATETDDALSAVAGCTADQALTDLFSGAIRLAEDQAQVFFGRNVRFDNRTSFSTGGGLSGDLDAVFPLPGLSFSASEGGTERAFFMQTGVTRWTDGWGVRHNDIRHGLVHRFALSDGLENGIFGTWAFVQQNLERGHERFVTGMDYAGRWGTGSLNYFKPTTSWRLGRPGYEERALEGMELDLWLDATDTIGLNAATGRWEKTDGSGSWTARSRLGFDWRPHPWLRFTGNWTGVGVGDEAMDIRAGITIPLGGSGRDRPRWQGIGLTGSGAAPSASDLWRSVDSVGRIEVAERAVSTIAGDSTATVVLRFLQNSVDTGGTVRVEVALSSPASTETRLEVRLVPGSGDNPAVPGQDYVDETVEVIIPAGESTAEATFQLLDNPSLQTAHSLSVTAVVVA